MDRWRDKSESPKHIPVVTLSLQLDGQRQTFGEKVHNEEDPKKCVRGKGSDRGFLTLPLKAGQEGWLPLRFQHNSQSAVQEISRYSDVKQPYLA